MKLPEKQVQNIDRPDLAEVYSDSLGMSTFDGSAMRIEFCVTRMNPPRPPEAPTAKRYPSCRLVLAPTLVVDLANQLNQMIAMMEKQGLVKRDGSGPPTLN